MPGWAALIDGSVELQGNNFTTCTTAPFIDLPAGDTPLYGGATVIHTYENVRICGVCVFTFRLPTQHTQHTAVKAQTHSHSHPPRHPFTLRSRCAWPRPLPDAGCFKGAWTVPTDLVLPAGGRVNVSVPIIILGSFTQDDTTTLAISVNGSLPGAYLNVSGTPPTRCSVARVSVCGVQSAR